MMKSLSRKEDNEDNDEKQKVEVKSGKVWTSFTVGL